MPADLTISNLPDDLVMRLREQGARHHRSLLDELMTIIEATVREQGPASASAVLVEIRRLGLRTPSEAAAILRADRDGSGMPNS